MNVEFHPAALREVEEAQGWYEKRSLFAASAFLRELRRPFGGSDRRPSDIPRRKLERAGFFLSDFRSLFTIECARTH